MPRSQAEHEAKSLVLFSQSPFLAYHPRVSHMSQNRPQTSSSANYRLIFDNALETYKKKTGKDLRLPSDPLLRRLESCNSPDTVLDILREQIPAAFAQSGNRLTTWVKPTINVLYTFSSTIGSAVGLVSMVKVITQDRAIISAF